MPTQKNGFTLTEVAIVLGVIGIVLASIWNAASRAASQFQDNKGWADIQSMMNSLHNFYQVDPTLFTGSFQGAAMGCNHSYVVPSTPTSPGGSPPANAGQTAYYNSSQGTVASSGLVAMGIFPGDMLSTAGGVSAPVSPWGGDASSFSLSSEMITSSCNTDGTTNTSPGASTQSNSLNFTFYNMTAAQCADIMFGHISAWATYGLQQVCVGANDGNCTANLFISSGPTTPAALATIMTLPSLSYLCTLNNSVSSPKPVSLTVRLLWPPSY